MFRKALTIEEAPELKDSALFAVEQEQADERISPMTDEARFEIFYGEHARALWSYVRRVGNDDAIADDIVQESFLRFLGASPAASRSQADFNEKAYLYRIATNLTYDYFRRNTREAKHQTNLETKEFACETTAFSSETAQVFDRLKTQERALLWLAYVEGHNHSEIGEMLGLKSLSVRVLLFRARRKLANLLEAK
jgi:RNA polymerase sigma-70 factor (ECF subfamily)